MKICPKCNISHEKSGTFCSRSCANNRGPRTEEVKKKISDTLLGRPGRPCKNKGKNLVPRVDKTCPNCNHTFLDTQKSTRKYCSTACSRPHKGGYREGSGRSKSGYYNGIYCGSTYELAWLIYQIDHNLEFSRFPGCLEYNGKKYFPDFLQNGIIVEIKGYEKQDSVDAKTAIANENGYVVLVLRGEALQKEFNWVKERYTFKNLYELYDGYKPKYSYICDNCGVEFHKDHKKNTEVKFCSRLCAGKGHKGRVSKSYNTS